jgi:mannose-6-phosphate isomerase-like protein (cupin superfamily)
MLGRLSAYERYMQQQGLPTITGYGIDDLLTEELKPWELKGGLGAFINLEGSEENTGCYLAEIPPGASLKPQKHLYEEVIYILSGRGATTIWREGSPKQTFE